MAKLEIALLTGEETKKFLSTLTFQIDRLENLVAKLDTTGVGEAVEKIAASEPEEEEDFSSNGSKPKKGSFEDDETDTEIDEELEEAIEESEESEEEEEAPKVKKLKTKKITVQDCNDAAKALCRKADRKTVEELMKKHFKTKSISELKPEQYGKFVTTMNDAAEAL